MNRSSSASSAMPDFHNSSRRVSDDWFVEAFGRGSSQ